jgi:hypothetical protein
MDSTHPDVNCPRIIMSVLMNTTGQARLSTRHSSVATSCAVQPAPVEPGPPPSCARNSRNPAPRTGRPAQPRPRRRGSSRKPVFDVPLRLLRRRAPEQPAGLPPTATTRKSTHLCRASDLGIKVQSSDAVATRPRILVTEFLGTRQRFPDARDAVRACDVRLPARLTLESVTVWLPSSCRRRSGVVLRRHHPQLYCHPRQTRDNRDTMSTLRCRRRASRSARASPCSPVAGHSGKFRVSARPSESGHDIHAPENARRAPPEWRSGSTSRRHAKSWQGWRIAVHFVPGVQSHAFMARCARIRCPIRCPLRVGI